MECCSAQTWRSSMMLERQVLTGLLVQHRHTEREQNFWVMGIAACLWPAAC